MSIRNCASVLALVAAVASTAQTGVPAQAAPPTAAGTTIVEGGAVQQDQTVGKPFRQLFGAQPAAPPDSLHLQDRVRDRLRALEQAAAGLQSPRTVCGLTVWNVDPDIDPRMRLQAPQPPDVTYAIRKLTPPVCRE